MLSRRALILSLAITIPLITFDARAADIACSPRPAAPFESRDVTDDGLVGIYFHGSSTPGPALLVLGGSEGGINGARSLGNAFAAQGYNVLALAYFGADGLPANMQEVPLEYFDRAADWLARQPEVDAERIGIYGVSKGGEASLLIASHNPRFRAVAAGVPSNVVWQNINRQDFTPRSSWTAGGQPLAYAPYDFSHGFTSIFALYNGTLENGSTPADAIIPVERINGPVLLLSGREDTMWPSSRMSDAVIARLDANHFAFPHTHLAFDNAGHAVGSVPQAQTNQQYPDRIVGGTDEGNLAARREAWAALTCFFDRSLAR
ncbi:MAG: prolyl oligopeptidase family serine peptidase [Alphaproteobacteria bacterium]|nr:prolyl oligopeptidase family serine peptidase [Alphaproteobacteria bacterium]